MKGTAMAERLLCTLPFADRFFLMPTGHEVPPGDLMLGGLNGEECGADPAGMAPYEISEEAAQAYVRRQAEEASAGVMAALDGLVGGLAGARQADELGERLGL